MLKGAMGPDMKVILELGSWLGKSTRFFASSSLNASVIAIDHWKGSTEHHQNPDWKGFLPTLYETFIKNCWIYKDRIIPVRNDTVSGMKIVAQYEIHPDLIFIDASHDYASVKADLTTALCLFPDAAICGDDYQWSDLQKAIREQVGAGKMQGYFSNNVWWKEHPFFRNVPWANPISGISIPSMA